MLGDNFIFKGSGLQNKIDLHIQMYATDRKP